MTKAVKFLLILLIAWVANGVAASTSTFTLKRIAHAGGGLGKLSYTNSYEALDQNLARGFEYFEIDFVFTSDGHLVCLHDWDRNFEHVFGFSTGNSLSLAEFERLAANNPRFRNCTLAGLSEWMRENPTAVLVTDVKMENLKALEMIRQAIPDAERRVIPQIYHPREFDNVRAMGFRQVIWTLYRIQTPNDRVVGTTARWTMPFAITMPVSRAESGLAVALLQRGIPTYVHTVNSVEDADRLMREFGVREIYTDFLPP